VLIQKVCLPGFKFCDIGVRPTAPIDLSSM
jgi:hypothetical protein